MQHTSTHKGLLMAGSLEMATPDMSYFFCSSYPLIPICAKTLQCDMVYMVFEFCKYVIFDFELSGSLLNVLINFLTQNYQTSNNLKF